MGLCEVRKRGSGHQTLPDGYNIVYSGVGERDRATEGVAIVMGDEIYKIVESWQPISSRIIAIDIELSIGKTTVIQVYAPVEDAAAIDKDQFYEDLQRTVDDARNKGRMIMISGDLNARTGNDKVNAHGVMGPWGGEKVLNSNGQRLIEFSIENNMLIGNSWFNHKTIHKITFESRGERTMRKSIIDYFIIDRDLRRLFTDIKVIRGAELSTDHKLLIADTKIVKPRKRISKSYERIDVSKLKMENKQEEYGSLLGNRLQEVNGESTLDNLWKEIKNCILITAGEVCGIQKVRPHTKKTKWWNDEVQKSVKLKKEAWKIYNRTKSPIHWDEYVRSRNETKRIIKSAKTRTWEKFGQELEENYRENIRKFWHITKALKGNRSKPVRNVKDMHGKLVTEEEEVLEVWRQYFQEKFGMEERPHHNYRDCRGRRRVEENYPEDMDNAIGEDEVELAVNKIQLGKAPGPDGIAPEFIKHGGNEMTKCLQMLFQKIWDLKQLPQEWENNIIIPIHKKGNQSECGNYRPICLSSVVYKVYTRILEQRLRSIVEQDIEEEQAAFRHGRQTQDHIFSLRMIVEKAWDRGKVVYLAFLDLRSAFDSVQRSEIWDTLKTKRVPANLVSAIKSVYQAPKGIIRLNGQTSRPFHYYKGVKQGDSLSPLLFILLMDEIWKVCKRRCPRALVGYWNLTPVLAQAMIYADDIVLIADSEEALQASLDEWNEELKIRGLHINPNKSKIMCVGRDNAEPRILFNGEPLELTNTYRYLGTIISKDGKIDQEVLNRVKKANGVYHQISKTIIGKQEVSRDAKIRIFKSVFLPVLLYGSESWTALDKHVSRITSAEMRFLRRIVGKTRRDCVRNERIREDLDVKPVRDTMQERQLKWYGHVCRMDDTRKARWYLEARPEGRRPRGRPRCMYTDYIGKLGTARGRTIPEMRRLARDRSQWARWTETATPRFTAQRS